MTIDAAGLRELSPRGLSGAAGQGYDVVLAGSEALRGDDAGRTTVPQMGELPEGEAAAALAAIGEGVCICTLEGSLIWANDRFKAFDDQTRARITAVCRRAAAQYEEQILRQEAAGHSFGSQ